MTIALSHSYVPICVFSPFSFYSIILIVLQGHLVLIAHFTFFLHVPVIEIIKLASADMTFYIAWSNNMCKFVSNSFAEYIYCFDFCIFMPFDEE